MVFIDFKNQKNRGLNQMVFLMHPAKAIFEIWVSVISSAFSNSQLSINANSSAVGFLSSTTIFVSIFAIDVSIIGFLISDISSVLVFLLAKFISE